MIQRYCGRRADPAADRVTSSSASRLPPDSVKALNAQQDWVGVFPSWVTKRNTQPVRRWAARQVGCGLSDPGIHESSPDLGVVRENLRVATMFTIPRAQQRPGIAPHFGHSDTGLAAQQTKQEHFRCKASTPGRCGERRALSNDDYFGGAGAGEAGRLTQSCTAGLSTSNLKAAVSHMTPT